MNGVAHAWTKPSLMFVACLFLSWYALHKTGEPSLPPISSAEATVDELEISLGAATDKARRPFASFAAIVERPVFSPSRRPAVMRKQETAEPVAELDFRLQGVIVSDAVRMAILSRPGGQSVIRLLEGENYQGWELVTVAPAYAIFRHQGSLIQLMVDHKRDATPRKPPLTKR